MAPFHVVEASGRSLLIWIESSAKRFSRWLVINRSREPVCQPSRSSTYILVSYYGIIPPSFTCFHSNQLPSYYGADLIFIFLCTHFSFHICDLAPIAKLYHSHQLQPDSLSQATKTVDSSAYSDPHRSLLVTRHHA